jgi:type III secretory pathway lipoprotein EscJ
MVVPLLVLLFLAKVTLVDLDRKLMSEMAVAVKALLAETQAVVVPPETVATGSSQALQVPLSTTQAAVRVLTRSGLPEQPVRVVRRLEPITAAVAQLRRVMLLLVLVA